MYSPKVEAKIKTTYDGIIDITDDLVQGSLTLRENRPHSFIFKLQNVQRKYDGVIRPMDPIVVSMRRFGKPIKIFTGYLNNGPVYSVWPRVLELSASCTLKRLQYWFWDPTSLEAVTLLNKWQEVNQHIVDIQGGGQQQGQKPGQQPGQQLPPPPLTGQGGPTGSLGGQPGQPGQQQTQTPQTPTNAGTGIPVPITRGPGQPGGNTAPGRTPTAPNQPGSPPVPGQPAPAPPGQPAPAPAIGTPASHKMDAQGKPQGGNSPDPNKPGAGQNTQQPPGTNNATGSNQPLPPFVPQAAPPNPADPNTPAAFDPNNPNAGKPDPNAPQKNAKPPMPADGGIKELVISLLTIVAGWPKEKIHIGKLPDKWLEYVEEIAKEVNQKTDHKDLIGQLGAGQKAGDGGQGGASGGQLHPGNYGGVNIDADQAKNASIIYNVGKNRGLPRKAMVIALATAMQESTMKNLNHGDRDSLGLFQQRPSQGWGSPQQITDPVYASNKFYDSLAKVGGWEGMPVTVAAQAVQRSGFPGAYAKWEAMANAMADAMERGGGAPAGGAAPGGSAPTPSTPSSAPAAPSGGAPQIPNFPNGETFQFMEEQIKKIFPDVQIMSRKRPGDSGYHGAGQALDVVLGPGNAKAVELAEGIFKAFPNATQIISQQWRGGLGRLDPSGKGRPAAPAQDHVYAQDNPDHVDHVHWAMKPDPLAWQGSNVQPGGGQSGQGGGEDPFNAVVNVYTWGLQPDYSGVIFFGPRAMINDSPLLPYIGNVMQAGLRNFCSAPNGDFMAWFPDHFGIWDQAAKMKIRPVELMDFTVEWSDQEIVTHQYVVGSPVGATVNTADFSVSSGSPGGAYMWQLMTQGIATMDFPKIFKLIFGEEASQKFVDDYLKRFGGRPNTAMIPYVQAGKPEFFMALVLFMQRWADQFHAEVPMTFMPELWPGMLLVLEEFSFQAYIKEVKHDFKYGPDGYFRTQAKINAPARLGKDGPQNDIFELLPLAGPRPLPGGDSTSSGPGTPSATGTPGDTGGPVFNDSLPGQGANASPPPPTTP